MSVDWCWWHKGVDLTFCPVCKVHGLNRKLFEVQEESKNQLDAADQLREDLEHRLTEAKKRGDRLVRRCEANDETYAAAEAELKELRSELAVIKERVKEAEDVADASHSDACMLLLRLGEVEAQRDCLADALREQVFESDYISEMVRCGICGSRWYTGTPEKHKDICPLDIPAKVICDGCNVRPPHEHRCQGDQAHVRDEPTYRPCECGDCNPTPSELAAFRVSLGREDG